MTQLTDLLLRYRNGGLFPTYAELEEVDKVTTKTVQIALDMVSHKRKMLTILLEDCESEIGLCIDSAKQYSQPNAEQLLNEASKKLASEAEDVENLKKLRAFHRKINE
jgi:hypothetical protein